MKKNKANLLYVNICGPHSNLYICQYCDSCKLIHLVLKQFIPRNYLAACLVSVHNSVYYINLNLTIKTTKSHHVYTPSEKNTSPNVLQIQNFHDGLAVRIYS